MNTEKINKILDLFRTYLVDVTELPEGCIDGVSLSEPNGNPDNPVVYLTWTETAISEAGDYGAEGNIYFTEGALSKAIITETGDLRMINTQDTVCNIRFSRVVQWVLTDL